MDESNDTYRTLVQKTEAFIHKDKGSKFIGSAFPVTSEDDIKVILDQLWSEHSKATHICYAWRLGNFGEHYRANDDGEPSNSAGMPILRQIQSFDLTYTLITVVRYYGGINLGVSGLISAYRLAAKEALTNALLHTIEIKTSIHLAFEYALLNKVMQIIKEENLEIIEQDMYLDCKMTIAIRTSLAPIILNRFEAIYGILVKLDS